MSAMHNPVLAMVLFAAALLVIFIGSCAIRDHGEKAEPGVVGATFIFIGAVVAFLSGRV